jgi:NADH-quinone oxidoreductase subunit G
VPTIYINGKILEVPSDITVMQACELAQVEVPRFCYHEKLAIAGNCRMCLVEVAGGPPKPVASCAMPVTENMQIFTDTPMVKKAREGVMEFLLINHPLDCPICDQAGECDLQDQAYQYGKNVSDFHEHKRAVVDKNLGPLIKTQMTRCIHCTRCVRFFEDIAGSSDLGAVNRGEHTEITTYLQQNITSELSGNIIDLCPVGALTSKPYAFKARSWELKKTETIDVMDGYGSNIRIDSRGLEVMRVLPITNEEINQEWISDKTRFSYDGLKYQRLNNFYIRNESGKLITIKYNDLCYEMATILSKTSSKNVGALTGTTLSLNEIFIFKSFLEKILVDRFDCRIGGENIDPSFSQNPSCDYLLNSTISDIENADACLLVGANIRKDAPLLNVRLRKAFAKNPSKIANIGTEIDLTYPVQQLGNDFEVLNSFLEGSHPFCSVLKQAKKPIIIFGNQLVKNIHGKAIIKILKQIAKNCGVVTHNYNGLNFVASNTGVINGLELGFATESLDSVICNSKVLFLHNADNQYIKNKINNLALRPFVIYLGSNGSYSAELADVIIPTFAYSEKSALYANIEGRIQASKQILQPLDNAIEDIKLFADISKILGIELDFNNQEQATKLMFEQYPHLANINSIPNRHDYLWQELQSYTHNSILSAIRDSQIKHGSAISELVKDSLLDNKPELHNSIAQSSTILNKLAN